MDSDGQLWTVVDLSSGLGFSRPLDKYPESEFDLSGGLGCSRPPDKHPESELDLSSGLEFSRSLDKYTEKRICLCQMDRLATSRARFGRHLGIG